MGEDIKQIPPPVFLIIDDNATDLRLAQQFLGDHGFVVEVAEDKNQALATFKKIRPDVVLLNIDMLKLNGLDTCRQLRRISGRNNVPILVATERENESSIDLACDAGATDFVTKPINWAILSWRVRYVLRASQALNKVWVAEEKAHHLAYYDGLTGLPNRELFKERLAQAISIARRQQWRVAALFMDLDEFKRINDTLGHAAGDELLVIIGERLALSIRDSDSVTRNQQCDADHAAARLGGDEFTVVLSVVHEIDEVTKVAKRIMDSLTKPVILGSQEVFITPSIGIALFPEDGRTVDTLLKNADAAMYDAKRAGKNKFRFYAQSMNERALRQLSMETMLHKALENEEFFLCYQPQVKATTGKIVGMEALIRWNSPDLGSISPVEFIPLVEKNGLIVDIGKWVLETACTQAQAWQDEGYPPMRLGVNISPRQFQQRNFISTLEKILASTGLAPRYLELELTENVLMSQLDETIATLDALCAMGITLSVDDFGTGYSSLSYLKRFPLTTLKIDRSFISGIPADLDDMAITQAIIVMAHSLKLLVIAEGVEDEQQLAYLCEQGCDEFQGYFFHKPLTVIAFTKMLDRQKAMLGMSRDN